MTGSQLTAQVTVANKTGHKLPTGVGFRRAFLQFSVLDDKGRVLWSSGRTNGAGVIVDERGAPIAGELWWKPDCSGRATTEPRPHQPHYTVIERQDQAQIYEELVSAPDTAFPSCGPGAKPVGTMTTSFLSRCAKVKDNRILPHGFLPLRARATIAMSLGAKSVLAEEVEPTAVDDDEDYRSGGADTLIYRVPLSADWPTPASIRATLYYQATPPYYLQDRLCTSGGTDAKRLRFIVDNLSLKGTPGEGWKLTITTSANIPLP
jgi:hypothetical protein